MDNNCDVAKSDSDRDILSNVRIASPCAAKWGAMPGGERVRSCAQCGHKVYNLSEMTSAQAADLIRNAEGNTCVRLYRRADGSVMTHDCPTGLRAARRRVARTAAFAFASVFSALGLLSLANRIRSGGSGVAEMGAVAIPAATAHDSGTSAPGVTDPTLPDAGDPTVYAAPSSDPDPTTSGGVPVQSDRIVITTKVSAVDAWGQPAATKRFLPLTTVKESAVSREDPFAPLPKQNAGKAGRR